jgi:hypothetical protein
MDNKQAVRVETSGADGQRQLVCTSEPASKQQGAAHHPFSSGGWRDCVADVDPGSQLFITLDNGTEGHAFAVPDAPGSELDLKVLPATRGAQKGFGAMLIVGGSIGVLVGTCYLSLAGAFGPPDDSSQRQGTTVMAAGLVTIGLGVLVLVSGSREPRVESEAKEQRAARGRDDVALGDVASARPRDRSATRPALTPLGFSLTF